jgi:hypothetical protein
MPEREKLQTPNTKLQKSIKLQAANDQAGIGFEALSLRLFWSLVFGV